MVRFIPLAVCVFVGLIQAASTPISHLEWAKKTQGRYAYGLYFNTKKVGWLVEEMKPGKHDGKDVVFSTTETYMVTLFDGEKSVKEEKSTTCYEVTGEGQILFANSVRSEDGKKVIRKVERQDKGLKITTKQGDDRVLVRTVAMSKDTLAHQRRLEGWLAGARKKEDKFTKYGTAWEEKDVNTKQTYVYKEAQTVLLSGISMPAHSVQVLQDGSKIDAVILNDTRTISATMGRILHIKLEQESVAKKMDGKLADLSPLTAVYIDRQLGIARNVDALKLEITGLGEFQIPVSHRQTVKTTRESTTLEVLRDFRPDKPVPLTRKEKREATEATPRLQCDHEQIKSLAKKIVGAEKDALKAARLIEDWVYRNLKKSYSDNGDTALEVLDRKAGDCTEHSILFVALARAAGIPAREVGGLAYVPGIKPAFGWHAWAEIHDGHQWVSIDPTWNQVFVDATHLKMSTGERDLAWTNIIGTIKIKVLEVKSKKDKEKEKQDD